MNDDEAIFILMVLLAVFAVLLTVYAGPKVSTAVGVTGTVLTQLFLLLR